MSSLSTAQFVFVTMAFSLLNLRRRRYASIIFVTMTTFHMAFVQSVDSKYFGLEKSALFSGDGYSSNGFLPLAWYSVGVWYTFVEVKNNEWI